MTAFPGEENHHIQRALLEVADKKRLYTRELDILVKKAELLINPDMTEAEIAKVLEGIDLSELKLTGAKEIEGEEGVIFEPPPPSEIAEPTEVEEIEFEEDEMEEPTEEEILAGTEEIDETDERLNRLYEDSEEELSRLEGGFEGGSIEPLSRGRIKSPLESHQPAISGSGFAEGDIKNTIYLQQRVEDLTKALEEARKETKDDTRWWNTALFLTPKERQCVSCLFDDLMTPIEIGQRNGMTVNQVIGQVQSAFSKYRFDQMERRGKMATVAIV